MAWLVLGAVSGLLVLGTWTLVSMFLMLRDYDDIDWDDEEF